MPVPAQPKIYHIVHVDRLASIISDGWLWCDAEMVANPRPGTTIGMSTIKGNRLTFRVKCYPDGAVGDYVPFYFCPRSVMLYLIHMRNHPQLTYRGGQEPIIHLEANLHEAITWAEAHGRRWAFSLSNAGAAYTEFRNDRARLGDINWDAVETKQWQASEIRHAKQAEFLVQHSFPFHLVRQIGVHSFAMRRQVQAIMNVTGLKVPVVQRPDWYY